MNTDLTSVTSPPNWVEDLSANLQAFQTAITPLAIAIGTVIKTVIDGAAEWERRAIERHKRAELLQAYKRRHSWRQSDIRPLLTLDVSENARRRMARVPKGRGRPKIKPHQPLHEVILRQARSWEKLFAEGNSLRERRRLFLAWPFADQFIEAIYRGELEANQARKTTAAALEAERAVADILCVSMGKVHSICSRARKSRCLETGHQTLDAMPVAKLSTWLEQGGTSILD